MNRRKFIQNNVALTSAAFLGMHDILGCSSLPGLVFSSKARILHLDLLTGSSVNELKKFYTEIIGLPLVSEHPDHFIVRAGETTIRFKKTNEQGPAPFYHFAFNIPENKILKAREWQLKRTALSATPSHMTDAGYPNDIRHFQNWNAHSIFFWDPAGNLVEYIARHDLKNSNDEEFTSKDLVCASEIAFIVDNTETIADEIKTTFELSQYKGGDGNFRAIGDENGLLLIIKKGRVWESHTNISKTPDIIKTSVTIKANKVGSWRTGNYPFEITVKS